MTREQAIHRMRLIQAELDKGMKRTRRAIVMALFAEYGEYLNETKASWAWWKRNDRVFEEDMERAREEAIDMLHFWLSLLNISEGRANIPTCLPPVEAILADIFPSWKHIYAAYIEKARENLRRWGRSPSEIDLLVGEEHL